MRFFRRAVLVTVLVAITACEGAGIKREFARHAPPRDTVLVYGAASLAVPLGEALDAFIARDHSAFQSEHGASLELARRITELHRVPDVIALADLEVFPQLLQPRHVAWYAAFARNRMVVAYTARSRRADAVDSTNWYRILLRPDVTVGRSDPSLAPAGYRALIMYSLAESWYHVPGLAARLAARTTPGLMRGNAADLAALLEAGELDYIVDYESLARAHGFRWIDLPPAIDLGDASRGAEYARASVRVKRGHDSVLVRGAPILYGVSIPREAKHPAAALRFLEFLLGPSGHEILRQHGLDALAHAEFRGDSVLAPLRQVVK